MGQFAPGKESNRWRIWMNKLKGLYYFVSLILLVVTLIYRLSKTAKRSDILEQLASYIDFVWISFILLYVYDFIAGKLAFLMGGEV